MNKNSIYEILLSLVLSYNFRKIICNMESIVKLKNNYLLLHLLY